MLKMSKVTDGWFRRTLEKWPTLSFRRGDATANVRMDCLNKETIPQYFELLKDIFSEHKLLNSPAQIYNVDEMGMPLNHRAPRVVTKRGQKKVRCCTSGNKSQITVMTGARVLTSVTAILQEREEKKEQEEKERREGSSCQKEG